MLVSRAKNNFEIILVKNDVILLNTPSIMALKKIVRDFSVQSWKTKLNLNKRPNQILMKYEIQIQYWQMTNLSTNVWLISY